MKRIFVSLCTISLFLVFSGLASAAPVPAVSFTLVDPTAGLETWGYEFHVNSDINVTAFGCWDYGDNGLNWSHDVGLWTSAGSFLGSVTVPSGTTATLDNHYRYVNLSSPITLSSGNVYRVGAEGGGDHIPRAYLSNIVTDSRISLTSKPTYRHSPIGDFGFPNQNVDSVYGYPAANFKIDAVPIPSAVWLLGSGLVGLVGFRKKFKK